MLSFTTYELPTGARSLVLVEVPDTDRPFAVLDVPLDEPLKPDSDCRVVADGLGDYFEARHVGHRHYVESTRLGRPAVAA
ncbi:MAG TPA: hypothetical protein VF549_08115 [Solirubrobacteraceae bacterium]|jgi:hypothetical protein